jgi:TonB family protein
MVLFGIQLGASSHPASGPAAERPYVRRPLHYSLHIARIICATLAIFSATAIATTIRSPSLYPEEALRNCVEGWVLLELTIATDGTVQSAHVLDAQPPSVFDEAAIKAVLQWKYDESPSVRTIETKFNFEIDDRECASEEQPE